MQIIIRILSAGIPVFDFTAGEIADGQFKPFAELQATIEQRFPAIVDLVAFNDLLGTQAYLKPYSLGALTTLVTAHPNFAGMQFYPNFLVFNLEDHVEAKEKDA